MYANASVELVLSPNPPYTCSYNYLMAKLHQIMTDGTSSSLAMFVSNFM